MVYSAAKKIQSPNRDELESPVVLWYYSLVFFQREFIVVAAEKRKNFVHFGNLEKPYV